MKVGVVSDTHNNLKNCNKIVELFNEAGVDRVIHTGDITQAKNPGNILRAQCASMGSIWQTTILVNGTR